MSVERPRVPVHLPSPPASPFGQFRTRLLVAIGLICFVAMVAYLDRSGYRDAAGGDVGLLDAFYYATVSITTTGYGDVIPVTDRARLLTTLLVTPARILFLILLVGTTIEILAERTRSAYRERIWRRRLRDHTIVCGYGTKGRSAVTTLLGQGVRPESIVVIDSDRQAVEQANLAGLTAIVGSAESTDALEGAGVRDAIAVIVATDRDDAAVLVTLTARELNPSARIVSAVREEENAHLLRQSGASSVITSSGAAGRLLGIATQAPAVVEVLEDLLSVGSGLDIQERAVEPGEVGPLSEVRSDGPVLAVVRDGEVLRFDQPEAAMLRTGDHLVCLCINETR